MPAAERQYLEREDFRAALESVCPNIVDNKFIPYLPHAKQAVALGLHLHHDYDGVFHFMYGGAAGGGKSDMLLMAAAQYVHHPKFKAQMIRKTLTELVEPGALLNRAKEWWLGKAQLTSRNNKWIFVFPSGAQVAFGYMNNPDDHIRYKGGEYHLVCIDEVTEWKESMQPDYVGFSRIRKRVEENIPLRYIVTANPDGPGYAWVKERFIGEFDLSGNLIKPGKYPYLPATIYDNPAISQEEYMQGLSNLPYVIAQQLMLGDWRVRMPGDFFRSPWFGAIVPESEIKNRSEWRWIRWWDLAASEKEDACYTCGVLMGKYVTGVRVVKHVARFRATPGTRNAMILQRAQIDGRHVTVGFEIEGGSGGPAQYEELERMLKAEGFRVCGEKPRSKMTNKEQRYLYNQSVSERAKCGRADPVSCCCERGYQKRGESEMRDAPNWGIDRGKGIMSQTDGIRLMEGDWIDKYLVELEAFPEGAFMDQVDATSGAWAWLEAHSAGTSRPVPMPERKVAMVDGHALREDRFNRDKDRRGRWLP